MVLFIDKTIWKVYSKLCTVEDFLKDCKCYPFSCRLIRSGKSRDAAMRKQSGKIPCRRFRLGNSNYGNQGDGLFSEEGFSMQLIHKNESAEYQMTSILSLVHLFVYYQKYGNSTNISYICLFELNTEQDRYWNHIFQRRPKV